MAGIWTGSDEKDLPTTIEALKRWLVQNDVDQRQFAVDREPDWQGYYIMSVPHYWTVNLKDWPAPTVVVRCDNEADVCRCFCEVVKGVHGNPSSLTSRLRAEMQRRIEESWRVEDP